MKHILSGAQAFLYTTLSCGLVSLSGAMDPVELPYTEDFCCSLPENWIFESSNEGRIQIRDGRLLLDDSVNRSAYSLNQAILKVNMENQQDVVLSFNHLSHADEQTNLPVTFAGSANGDGLALSVDRGESWFRVASFIDGGNRIDLSRFLSQRGLQPSADIRLNFMQYDNFGYPADGRSFDNVKITSKPLVDPVVPVSLPYTQNFATKPDAAAGWTYDSTEEGRITVVSGALRMDDRQGNRVYSQNKAVLNVDLAAATNPVLTFRARETSDETHRLPDTFQDAKGDGVAISANGTDWVRLLHLGQTDRNWRTYTVDLADAGLAFGGDMRIAFMQYDNYPYFIDGWEFDDVEIKEGVADVTPLQPPPVPSVTIAAGDDMAEAPIGYWSIGSADYADGREPNNRLSRDTFWKQQGAASIQFNTDSGFETRVGFPTTRDANWDLRTVRSLRFNLFVRSDRPVAGPQISLVNGEERFIYTPGPGAVNMVAADENWVTVEVPIAGDANWTRTQVGNPSMAEIDALEIMGDSDAYGFAFWIDDVRFDPPVETVLPGLTAPDLTVGWIERTPKSERYLVDYPNLKPVVRNAGTKRWPDVGEAITWTAHIANRGRTRASTFTLNWYVGNARVQSTRHNALPPGGTTSVDLRWNWQASPHTIRAEIVPDFPGERTVLNDELTIGTDDMTFGFVIEKGTINHLNATPNRLGSIGYEDWLQTVIDDMHRRFALSTYDFAPNGVEMRLRIGKITVTEDNVNPGPFAPIDLEVDGGWRFPTSGRGEYRNFNILYNHALVHELMHQLGVIDTYQFHLGREQNEVNTSTYGCPYASLMGGSWEPTTFDGTMLGPHSVHSLNSSIGYRRGHYGVYLYDLPRTIRVQVTNAAGVRLANTDVRFYQRRLDRILDGTPEFTLRTDGNGLATLPNRSVDGSITTATGQRLQDNPFGVPSVVGFNGFFLMEVRFGDQVFHQPFLIEEANVAFARGFRGTYTIQVQTDF